MTSLMVPVEEYFTTSFHPDVDFVDGILEERHWGEREHGDLEFNLMFLLRWQRILRPCLKTRLEITSTRYRVPDVCAYDKKPEESILTIPPVLCIEVMSPEDRQSRIQRVVQDYRSIGVPNIWLFDPLKKRGFTANGPGPDFVEVFGEISTVDGRVVLALDEIFSEM